MVGARRAPTQLSRSDLSISEPPVQHIGSPPGPASARYMWPLFLASVRNYLAHVLLCVDTHCNTDPYVPLQVSGKRFTGQKDLQADGSEEEDFA